MNHFFSQLPKIAIFFIGAVCILVLAFLDFVTGYEATLVLFYVFPIAMVAWYGGIHLAIITSVLSAALWAVSTQLAGQTYSHDLFFLWNSGVRLGFFLIICGLLVKLKSYVEKERLLSLTDSLTNIANRRAFDEFTKHELSRARRFSQPVTIVYLDVDNFKYINDHLGHTVGDTLLQKVATVLRNNARVSDVVARIGGDEFCILLTETDSHRASEIVQRIKHVLTIEMQINAWPVGFSIGVLTCTNTVLSVDEMVNKADELMYRVKNSGKDAISYSIYSGQH